VTETAAGERAVAVTCPRGDGEATVG